MEVCPPRSEISLELNEAHRAERKSKGEITANIKAEFPGLNLPFGLSTLYSRTTPWTNGVKKCLHTLMVIVSCVTQGSFSFVIQNWDEIHQITHRVPLARTSGQAHGVQSIQREQEMSNFINAAPFPERSDAQHRRQWKQLKSRVLVPCPQLHKAHSFLSAPCIASPVPLPCLMECEIKTPKMGIVSVIAVLAYVDVEDPVGAFDETKEQSTSGPFFFDDQRGELWFKPRRSGDDDLLHRSLMLHSIQSIRPYQAGIDRRLLGAKFSSLNEVFTALGADWRETSQHPAELWHLSANPRLTLAHVIKYQGFANHLLNQTPLTLPDGWKSLMFRDAFCCLCWMECKEWQCGNDCIHQYTTIPMNPFTHGALWNACRADSLNSQDNNTSSGGIALDSRIWAMWSTTRLMAKFTRCVVNAPHLSTPVINHWNALMEAVFSVELGGVRWTTLEVYPHVDMIQGDLDVQTLCCYLPPDHLHVRSNLANGNTLYYWLEDSSDKHMYQVLKAMHGQHPYWNARVHFFEVSSSVIDGSPLLKEKLQAFNADNTICSSSPWSTGKTQSVGRTTKRGDRFWSPSDRFLTWVKEYLCTDTLPATHRLMIRHTGNATPFLDLHAPEFAREEFFKSLADDLSNNKFCPLFEVVPMTAGSAARLHLFVELFAPSEEGWDETLLLHILQQIRDSIQQFIRTTDDHRLYVSTHRTEQSQGEMKYQSLLIHSNITVLSYTARLIEAHLIRSLRRSTSNRDDRWESIIDPIRDGFILAPMLHTAKMLHCPQCFSTGQLITSQWCPFKCCHGWLQERCSYRLRGVFAVDGTGLEQEWRRLLQSPIVQWQSLTIRAPAHSQPAPFTNEVIWMPVLHHQLQWQGGCLSANRITAKHQRLIEKSRTILTEPKEWSFPSGLAVPSDEEMFQQLLACKDALTPGQLEDVCLLLSVKVRKNAR